jgi:hypothetical protein
MHKLTAALLSAFDILSDSLARLESKVAYTLEEWHADALVRVQRLATESTDTARSELTALEARARQILNAAEYALDHAEEKEAATLAWVRNELTKIGR